VRVGPHDQRAPDCWVASTKCTPLRGLWTSCW
jgi:hypothetical protein